MYQVLGHTGIWVQHKDDSIRRSVHTYRVGLWVLMVHFLQYDAFLWEVHFAPSGQPDVQLSIDELPPPHAIGKVRSGWSSTFDGALHEVAFAYRGHRSFMEDQNQFDVEAAVERANSEEVQNLIGSL